MGFLITVRPSGKTFQAEPHETLLDAAARQDLRFPYGCRSGTCGTCAGKVLAGTVDYPNGLPPALSTDELNAHKALLCQAHAQSDLEIEVAEIDTPAGITVKTLPARVITLQKLCHDVMLLRLKLPASERMQFLAGQYLEILLKGGKTRAFSLANAPHDDEALELHIREVPGGYFTHQVFHEMQEKTLLRIRGPLGTFFLRERSDRPVILVAGGTGFAPVKSIVEHALHIGDPRPFHIFWGVRARRDLYLGELPTRWANEHANIDYCPVLSEPGDDSDWQGETGFVHEAVLRRIPDLSGFDVYLCGPPPMINAAKTAFLARGLPETHLFYDSFEYSADAQQALRAQQPA